MGKRMTASGLISEDGEVVGVFTLALEPHGTTSRVGWMSTVPGAKWEYSDSVNPMAAVGRLLRSQGIPLSAPPADPVRTRRWWNHRDNG